MRPCRRRRRWQSRWRRRAAPRSCRRRPAPRRSQPPGFASACELPPSGEEPPATECFSNSVARSRTRFSRPCAQNGRLSHGTSVGLTPGTRRSPTNAQRKHGPWSHPTSLADRRARGCSPTQRLSASASRRPRAVFTPAQDAQNVRPDAQNVAFAPQSGCERSAQWLTAGGSGRPMQISKARADRPSAARRERF